MPLYTTDTALSVDVPCAEALAGHLSSTTAYKDLCNVHTASDALAMINVGEGEIPWDGESFSEDELIQRRCWCNVFDPTEGNEETGFLGEGVNELNQAGLLIAEVYFKPADKDLEDRGDCYRYFWDRTAALKNQIWSAVYGSDTQCPRLQTIAVIARGWTTYAREESTGAMLCGTIRVTWGDVEQ